MNKRQNTIQTWFDHVLLSDIGRSNDAWLEMAMADFFHSENIADCVVEFPRFKYLFKKAWLVGDELRPLTKKKMEVRIFFSCSVE